MTPDPSIKVSEIKTIMSNYLYSETIPSNIIGGLIIITHPKKHIIAEIISFLPKLSPHSKKAIIPVVIELS